jgi:hypothetical protein
MASTLLEMADVSEGTRATVHEQPVRIPAGTVMLDGDLTVPSGSRGIVVFAHGSGSSRHSPRNRYVADVRAALGTLGRMRRPRSERRRCC